MIVSESASDRWQCTVSTDDVDLVADTTGDHGGAGEGIRPHELLEATLATCLNMTVRMAAARQNTSHDGVTTTVDLDRDGDQPTFAYAVTVDGVDEEAADTLRAAARHCPVHETVAADCRFEPDQSLARE